MQSSFQQEVERANRLRKEAAAANAKSLADMQKTVDRRLTEMDTTIKIVHEGQTSNDTNIHIMMTKMDLFGAQMQRLEERLNGTPRGADNTTTPTTQLCKVPATDLEETEEETEWNEDFASSPSAFDAIMSDAESKKRMADTTTLAKAKKPKPQLAPVTRSIAQGRKR